ncbi:DUF3037 domain-containing protein [Olivibacter ginsenosidimutans]|uniref:DUF3037 domain-containing protein n=1 Tax=Olivibacter ginsenosidimutans TaxID=1176537 RepID=A0ABP9CCZ1_9SPHI
MQELHVYEYAVIRLVPQVEREEFLNIGVILYCAKARFLDLRFYVDKQRWLAFSNVLDVGEVQDYLAAFDLICSGGKAGGTIAALPMPDRFRWLTATRSTILQTSKVHVGLCQDPAVTLNILLNQLVLLK